MTTLLEGPASGLSGIFPQSGPTGGMGMAPPISIPTTEAPGSQFPAMSAMSSTTSTTSTSTSSEIYSRHYEITNPYRSPSSCLLRLIHIRDRKVGSPML
ncbi:uncharacterized protein MONOS_18308 [Monocercomonoides exilis]|uniref:uncharacterized protein n=1 Tax=Monocercomonoides exilis TaxID=2049356 RepID=UPI0035594552|nr:hypothetical protein MONOS_18308 [Monocercomonoides exilis]